MQSSGSPAPLEKTEPVKGQECFLYTYVLLREPKDGVIGFFKFLSAHGDPNDCKKDFVRVMDTNQQCPMKWGVSGEWEVIRTPETDTEGTIDIVKLPGEDEEFMGEKLPTRDVAKDNSKMEDIKERVVIDTYKDNVKTRLAQEKKLELRKKAMAELQKELDDPKALASYAQLQWQRLTLKSTIAEYQDKVKEAQVALIKNLKELHARKRMFPHYESQWQNEIRRIHKFMDPKHADVNPVDHPIANLGDEDDEELANSKISEVPDEFDQGIGVEAKGKEEATEVDQPDRIAALKSDLADQEDAIARSFLPDAPLKKLGPSGKKKNKKGKKGSKH